MAIWALAASDSDENYILDIFALMSAFIFLSDLYQVDTFLLDSGVSFVVFEEEE
tara:strand:+ start:505 stop:666 length:162 start_codon:yes stop_codon:yes gene_type:complete